MVLENRAWNGPEVSYCVGKRSLDVHAAAGTGEAC